MSEFEERGEESLALLSSSLSFSFDCSSVRASGSEPISEMMCSALYDSYTDLLF
jgi:hypothetical protein